MRDCLMAITIRKKASTKTKVKPSWKRKLKVVFAWASILGMVGFMGASVVAYQKLEKAKLLVPDLPGMIEQLNTRPSKIYSADGELLYSIQTEYRKAVSYGDIPEMVRNAMLAAEDKRFYEHSGVDAIALARIAVVALKDREASQGGSTLTMQIAKRLFTSDKQTLDRKLDDMALAVEIEKQFTKDQILALYMNQVFFGERAYGISAAADVYFGKTLEELTIAEAAMLMRCVRRPSDENPVRDLEVAIKNRNVVLAIMREEGMITSAEYQAAKSEPVKLADQRPRAVTGSKVHPYFVDYVLNELAKKKIDISAGGYEIKTTLKTKYQRIAEKGVDKWIDRLKGYRVNQMAMLVTDDNGRIVAMVGGPDYDKSEFNMIWMGPGRQLGSSMKPFVYLTGLDRGIYSEGSTISTKPIRKSGTREYVKGGANRGNISIASALAASNNTAAARAIEEVGEQNTLNLCRRSLGFRRSNLMAVQSLSLGSGEVYMTEVAEAYSVLQSHGDRYPTYAIERVIYPDGREESLAPKKARAVVDSASAEYIDLSLRQVVTGGTGRAASGVRNARGKTGTTSDHKDAWFCGYTDKLVGLVWVANEQIIDGRPSAQPMRGLFGGEGPARVWNDIMGDIQKEVGEKSRSFGRMPNVSTSAPDDEENDPDNTTPDEPIEVPEQPEDQVTPVVDPNDTGDGGSTPPATNTTGTTGGGTSTGGGNQGGGDDVVYVSVCADSGQRANAYCPETVRRPFFKGSEPKGGCPLHGATAEVPVGPIVITVDWLRDVRYTYSERKQSHVSQPHRSASVVDLLRHFDFAALVASDRSRG
ncbi:hypothetical protein CCB80_09595 [Armatimonadetes bacterium Uphvl-Ar1]|nr:hypothetical protein CCB80_09595 [Armatimonadetes bacterium Uphvl-Ar1]